MQLLREPNRIADSPFVRFSKTSAEPGVFNLHHKAKVQSALAQVEAIGKSQAVIEFKLDGTIVTANPNFLGAMGYTLVRSRVSITACSSIRPRARARPIANSGPA
jgi:hypothetical protein